MSFVLRLRALLFAVVALTCLLAPGPERVGTRSNAEAAAGKATPTLSWVNFYGLNSTLGGHPLPVGARITAYDPKGVECGEFVVTTAGSYGLMPVYGDDQTTEEDEGASPGDVIAFRINGLPARALGPDEARWTGIGDVWHVELAVGEAAAATPAPSQASPVASVTSSPSSPGGSTPLLPAPSATARAVSPTPFGALPVPTEKAAATPTGGAISPPQARPAETRSADSADTASSAGAQSQNAWAILGLATSTAPAVAPAQQSNPPATGSGTPSGLTGDTPSPQTAAGAQGTADSGSLALGLGIVLAVVFAFLWVRSRLL